MLEPTIKLGGGIGVDINKIIRMTTGYNAGLLNLSQFHVGVAYLF